MAVCPTFETERLLLREITKNDIPAWKQHLCDDEVRGGLLADSFFLNPESIFPIEGKTLWVWGIFLKSDPDQLIGMICLRYPGKPTNRAFWLIKSCWGQGIMTEVVAPIMEYAFTTLNFEKMTLGNALGHQKSRRIKEKEGAVFIRIEPTSFVNTEFKEREIWELTKERWIASKLRDPQAH